MVNRATHSFNDLDVPFLFVPAGQEPPPEWLAEHAGWVKFPARFVPRETSAGPSRVGPA